MGRHVRLARVSGRPAPGRHRLRLHRGPSRVGGVTPAVDMADVLDYGASSALAAADRSMFRRRCAPISRRMPVCRPPRPPHSSDCRFHSRFPASTHAAATSCRTSLDQRGLSAIVDSPAARPTFKRCHDHGHTRQPGGNFAGVVSYGDITLAGYRHATYVCGDAALAFGHPLTFRGAIAFGANNANAVTVVADPTLDTVQDGQRHRPVRQARPGSTDRHPGEPGRHTEATTGDLPCAQPGLG